MPVILVAKLLFTLQRISNWVTWRCYIWTKNRTFGKSWNGFSWFWSILGYWYNSTTLERECQSYAVRTRDSLSAHFLLRQNKFYEIFFRGTTLNWLSLKRKQKCVFNGLKAFKMVNDASLRWTKSSLVSFSQHVVKVVGIAEK